MIVVNYNSNISKRVLFCLCFSEKFARIDFIFYDIASRLDVKVQLLI